MRNSALAILVAISAAAHAIVFVAANSFSASWNMSLLNAVDPRIAAVNVRRIPAPQETMASITIVEEPSSPPTPLQEPGAVASEPADGSTAAEPVPPIHYYDSQEVDTPATPQPDWEVEVPSLMTAGIRKLSFDVWIDARGIARKCRVLNMEPPERLGSAPIAAHLCKTTLSPAIRHGVEVASVRHIELVLAE